VLAFDVQQYFLIRIAESMLFSEDELDHISFVVQVLRVNLQQFCETIILLKRIIGISNRRASELFLGCYLIANTLWSSFEKPMHAISSSLMLSCNDLEHLKRDCVDALPSLVIHLHEMDSLVRCLIKE